MSAPEDNAAAHCLSISFAESETYGCTGCDWEFPTINNYAVAALAHEEHVTMVQLLKALVPFTPAQVIPYALQLLDHIARLQDSVDTWMEIDGEKNQAIVELQYSNTRLRGLVSQVHEEADPIYLGYWSCLCGSAGKREDSTHAAHLAEVLGTQGRPAVGGHGLG